MGYGQYRQSLKGRITPPPRGSSRSEIREYLELIHENVKKPHTAFVELSFFYLFGGFFATIIAAFVFKGSSFVQSEVNPLLFVVPMLLGGTAFMASTFKSDKIEASMIHAIRELSRVSLGNELNMEEAVHLYQAMAQAESSSMPVSVEVVGDSLKLVAAEEQQSISSSPTSEKRAQDALARACWDSPLLEGIRQQMQALNRLTLTGEEKEIMERAKRDAIKVMGLHNRLAEIKPELNSPPHNQTLLSNLTTLEDELKAILDGKATDLQKRIGAQIIYVDSRQIKASELTLHPKGTGTTKNLP